MCCRGSEASPLGEYPEGVSPSGRFFGDFLIGEKVTRGAGRSARSLRAWELCSHIGGCGGEAPQKKPRVPHPPAVEREKRGAGAKSADLLPRGAPEVRPLASFKRKRIAKATPFVVQWR